MEILLSERRALREPEVERITGYSGMHIRRLEAAGKFPRRFRLDPGSGPRGAVAWDSLEIQQWVEERASQRITINNPDVYLGLRPRKPRKPAVA